MQFMYFYCYDYVFSLYVHLWLPWLRFFRAFFSVVRQMPGYNPQWRGTVRTLPSCCVFLCIFCVVLCIVCFVTLLVLFVYICVLNNCHWVATQLQLNISYHNTTCFLSVLLIWRHVSTFTSGHPQVTRCMLLC